MLAAVNQFWADGLKLISARLEPFSLSTWVDKLNKAVFGKAWMGRTVHVRLGPDLPRGRRADRPARLGQHDARRNALLGGLRADPSAARRHHRHRAYRDLVQWTLWGGVACMVTSGLLSFALQWRSMLRAFGNLGKYLRATEPSAASEVDAIETPMSWFLAGQLVSLVALAWLAHATFDMPYWQSTVAVLLTFFLALVACRVTGETDTTPIGAMGKVTQLIFGVLSPGNMNVNLMSANITAGAATSSADLLTDLKSGYLLGANPRKQFLAQFAGIFAGTLVTVLCFQRHGAQRVRARRRAVSRPRRADLEGRGRGAEQRARVARPGEDLVDRRRRPGGHHPAAVGQVFPKYEKWIPSAAGLGLAWTFHWYYSLLFFLGAVIGYGFEKTVAQASPKSSRFPWPRASSPAAR